MIRLSIIVPVLNSHEIVRRQIEHFKKLTIPDDVEIIYMDDGSAPPLEFPYHGLKNFRIVQTGDTRPWTWALARNAGARLARGEYLLMTDLDYIILQDVIDASLKFNGDRLGFKREFGVLDEHGNFTQGIDTLLAYGLSPHRIPDRGVKMPPHPNNFVMSKKLYWELGGYREDLIDKPYPQGEDSYFKKELLRAVRAGKAVMQDSGRPMLYMFPNGQYCDDVDYNPFELFHGLSRKSESNTIQKRLKKEQGQRAKARVADTKNRDLSIIIPARQEVFLQRTIEDILENIEADTEVIAICDGYWPDPPVQDHPRVTIVHHTEPIGQRAATNEGARISQAKFIMKADAHCAFGKGFDRILMEDCKPDWTMVPAMHNLHAFDWKCKKCGNRTYQGKKPDACEKCLATDFEMVMVWKPRHNKPSVSWRFDKDMHFQYWYKHSKRSEAQGDLIETMGFIGACFLMHRARFWEIDGLDEAHGFWGQFGTEVSCKSWLSGGKVITSKKTWFAHMFRTGNFRGSGHNGGSFPYPLSGKAQEKAKEYSKDLWLNDKWDKANYPLSWLVERFAPVPSWENT